MIMFRKGTSFPFLKIAREGGVPYGKVMGIATYLESLSITDAKALADRHPLVAAVFAANIAEEARRHAVEMANG